MERVVTNVVTIRRATIRRVTPSISTISQVRPLQPHELEPMKCSKDSYTVFAGKILRSIFSHDELMDPDCNVRGRDRLPGNINQRIKFIFETVRDFKNWAPSELEEHREQLFRSLDCAKRHYRANFKDVEKTHALDLNFICVSGIDERG